MYTPSKAYVTKFSSGTILALLAFSAILFLIPVVTPVHASNAATPSVKLYDQSWGGGHTTWVPFLLTNPASNQYALTNVIVTAPSGWTITECSESSGPFEACTYSSNSASFAPGSSTLPFAPGASQVLWIEVDFATSSSYPTSGTFSSSVQDQSSAAYYAGPTFKLTSFDPSTTIALSPDTGSTFIAGGSAIDFTATITPAAAGIQVYFLTSSSGSLSAITGTTSAAGSATMTFTPTNLVADSPTTVFAIVGAIECSTTGTGTPSGCYDWWDYDSNTVTTVPNVPTQVTFTLPGSADSTAPNHYSTMYGVDTAAVGGAEVPNPGITYSLADKFTNQIDFSTLTATKITFTALSGLGRFDLGNGTVSTYHCDPAGVLTCPASGTSIAIPYNYFQSTVYNTIGKLGATITATGVSVSGSSGNIITSSFAAGSPIPSVSSASVGAGSTVTVGAQVTAPIEQQGVPITLYLDTSTSTQVHNDGKFSTSSAQKISLTTDSTGSISTKYAVDTGATAIQMFQSAVAQPIDGDTTNTLTNSTDSAPVTTVGGPPAKFTVFACFLASLTPATCGANTVGSSVVNGTSVYVDVSITDAYGNVASNPGPNQIEVDESTSAGVLSVSHAYITVTNYDTYFSLGWVAWTLPSSLGTAVTLSASGVLSGKSYTATFKVTTVSDLPTFSVTTPTPVSGVVYSSSTTVVFSGQANASIGYPTTVNIASVGYKIGTSAWQSAIIAQANTILWSVAATFPVGLSTIIFNATDSNGNTFVSPSFSVLIDTTAPTLAFTTPANANLTGGAAAIATIVDSEGDLNYSSVAVTVNGTAVAAANIAVTPTANNLGHSVTYTVTIKNLPTGSDNLGISAYNLAGLSGTASVTVNVIVPFSQSVVINSAAQGTLGSFSGISVTATNLWSTSQNLVVFAVWKNGAGQTLAVTTGGLTLASGATGSAFAPLASALPSGSYSVSVFVITTGNNPVSLATSISATV